MLKVNEYFGGTVKSIALENAEGVATIGVMEDGEYEFGTGTIEHMTVTSGVLDVMLPGRNRMDNLSERRNIHRCERCQIQGKSKRSGCLLLPVYLVIRKKSLVIETRFLLPND